MTDLATALSAVVGGDISHFSSIQAVNHSELEDAAACLPKLLVVRSALMKVMKEWRAGRWTDGDIQQWASFIRRGYIAGGSDEIFPIDIEYYASDEALIAGVLARLDELGDQIDGIIDENEQEEILQALQ